MKTIIFPGGSIKNKQWAEQTASEIGFPQTEILQWETWKSNVPSNLDFDLESKKLMNVIRNDEANVIAKSVGTLVFCKSIPEIFDQVNKVVLCGLPLEGEGFTENDFNAYQNLKKISPERILIIQNVNDPLGAYSKIVKFIEAISPSIKVLSKDRPDHNYPFSEDFKNFLYN